MATTNFLQFDIQQTNMLTDANYSSDTERSSGFVTGISRSILFNKVLFQSSTMATAIANVLAARGYDAMDNNLSALQLSIDSAFSKNRGLPIGSIFPTTSPITVAPEGFLLPDGNPFDPSEYSDLANAYRISGDTYKYGQVYQNGVWYPKTPDLRGYFLRVHNSSSSGIDANRTIGTAQGDAIRNITGYAATGGEHMENYYGGAMYVDEAALYRNRSADYGRATVVHFDASRQVPTADENRPNNVALTYLIVAKDEANLGSLAQVPWGGITGDISNQIDLQNALNAKQDTLTQGTGIDITSNVISGKIMTGATGSVAGTAGLVPQPLATDNTKFLRGDGTWADALTNTATGTGSLTIDGVSSNSNYGVNIGVNSGAYGGASVAIGSSSSYWQGANAGGTRGIAIGMQALTGANTYSNLISPSYTKTDDNIAIGSVSMSCGGYSISLGHSAYSWNEKSVAIGFQAIAKGDYAIQLGQGTNNTANTLSVGLDATHNYELLNSSGQVPTDRYIVMTGADGVNAGTKGAVPAPAATDNTKFLRGDGTWTDLGTVLRYKGSVATYSNLPSSGQENGDVYNVLDTGKNYAWDGTTWDDFGGTITVTISSATDVSLNNLANGQVLAWNSSAQKWENTTVSGGQPVYNSSTNTLEF